MDKTAREVTVGRRELLDTLQIIHIIRKVHLQKDEINDAEFIGSLIWSLLDSLDNTKDNCLVKLDNEERFAIWLCLEQYRQFTEESNLPDHYNYVSNILTIFGGM